MTSGTGSTPNDEPTFERPDAAAMGSVPDDLEEVLESAAKLQRVVPDAVLVGGRAAALYAAHRLSYDHDHVVSDLRDRFDVVLDAIEREGDWVTNRVTPGKIILGELGGIEAGVRQLIRTTPLETASVQLRSGQMLTVPTPQEAIRVKAFLVVKRNQTRDFLDVAALSDRYGVGRSASVLARIDDYYSDPGGPVDAVASQLVRQLADARPKDISTTRRLGSYKGLAARWHDWETVRSTCQDLAAAIVDTRGALS